MLTFEVLEAYLAFRHAIALVRADVARDFEFGHNQISVLYRLSLSNANMGELAEYTSSDKASMSRTVAQLEKQGYVKRKPSKDDKRISIIELSAKGKIFARKAEAIRNAIGKKMDESLTPAERKQLVQLIQKSIENLKAKKN
ncbi:MAG: MarR family winged helix-turn-helix transcriptional regulator [Pseudobdellovibrionaceae bacterium]